MQQVHANGLIFDCGMNIDGNRDKAEGENTASDNPSHENRLTRRITRCYKRLLLTTEYIFRYKPDVIWTPGPFICRCTIEDGKIVFCPPTCSSGNFAGSTEIRTQFVGGMRVR